MSQSAMYRYPSMTSVHSMASMGHLPPGHGYIPRKQKPDKPYGPSFVTIMNRTWRGPGKTFLIYALVAWCVALLFYGSAGLYFGHRNVSRMMVLRTEVWGAIFIIIAILMTGLTFHFIWKARLASNDWRLYTKFRAEGLCTAAAYNHAYVPEDGMKLATGTYGPRALKEIPRPKPKGRSRRGSQTSQRNAPATSATSTTERRYEKKKEAEAPASRQEEEYLPPPPGGKPYTDAPPMHGSMEYLESEPKVLGYEPPPIASQSQPQRMEYPPPPPPPTASSQPHAMGASSEPQGLPYQESPYAQPQRMGYPPPPPPTASSQPHAMGASSDPQGLPYQESPYAQPQSMGYQATPSSSQSQAIGYQPPSGPEEPLSPTPVGLGYQPPPGPDDPSFNAYAQPSKRQRPPTSGYPDSHVSVPVLSPMPASPSYQVAPRYSMEEVHGVPSSSAPTIPVYGMPTPGMSESEL